MTVTKEQEWCSYIVFIMIGIVGLALKYARNIMDFLASLTTDSFFNVMIIIGFIGLVGLFILSLRK